MPSSGDKRSAEHMIARAQNSGAFERPEIGDRLDDDERVAVAPFVPAQGARIAAIDVAADAARHDSFMRQRAARWRAAQEALRACGRDAARRGAPSAALSPGRRASN